jgi:hypothetical protein
MTYKKGNLIGYCPLIDPIQSTPDILNSIDDFRVDLLILGRNRQIIPGLSIEKPPIVDGLQTSEVLVLMV